MRDLLTRAKLALSLRDMARVEQAGYDGKLDALRREYSKEQGYCVPLRRETFEAMLRAVPPEPGRGREDNTATHPARQDRP